MLKTLRVPVTAILSLFCLLTWMPEAQAEKVVVLPFSGPRSAPARAVIVRALGEDHEMVSSGDWARAAKRLGVQGRSAGVLKQVAAELGVDAVVTGGVRRVRRRWQLSVAVRSGATAEIVGRRGASSRNPGRMAALARGLAGRVAALVVQAGGGQDPEGGGADQRPAPVESTGPDPGEGPGPDPGGEELPEEDEALPAVVTSLPAGQEEVPQMLDEEDALAGAAGGPAGSSRRQRPRRGNPYGWLDLSLLASLSGRNLSVPINAACDIHGRREARLGATFGEIGGALAFYPGGIVTSRWPAGLGIVGSFTYNLGLAIQNRSTGDTVESSQYSFTVGGRYRWSTGSASRGLSIMAQAGVGRYSFTVSEENNDLVPTFIYDYVYLGLEFFVPLRTRYLGLTLGADYNPVFNYGGDEAVIAYNSHGQVPSVHGFRSVVGLGGAIVGGLRWQIGFELLGFLSDAVGKGQGLGDSSAGNNTACTLLCRDAGDSCYDETDEPVQGGIRTEGSVRDIMWRVALLLTYRFGWDADGQPPSRSDGHDAGGDDEDGGERADETWEEGELSEDDEDDWSEENRDEESADDQSDGGDSAGGDWGRDEDEDWDDGEW
jgi:hypothetical protein